MTKEEIKKWLLENCINENGDLDLSCLDFSDFDGNVDISELKVKKSLNQSWQKVGGDLRQNYQEADGRIFYDFGSLNYDFKKMSPTEKGEFIFHVFGGDDGKVLIDNVDMSDCESDVYLSLWKVGGNLYQGHQKVKGDLYQDNQKVEGSLHQGNQQAGWMEQAAEGAVRQGLTQGERKMTSKEKGQFLLERFKTKDGALELSHVDLSDFHGDVVLEGWKVGGDLFLDHQEVRGSLFQNNQKVGRNLFQDEQEAKGFIMQDMQVQEGEDGCVEPDYKAEYERLGKELHEANMKIETLLWALEKAKDASK